jgi:REP element-mobilizing transposase RayT
MPIEKFSSAERLFQNQYRIPSARATWHDYNGGIYFVTICTKNHIHYFGEIKNNTMHLNEIGKCASENLQNINAHYPYAEIPLFVVMPNHIHAIVFIDGKKTPYQRRNTNINSTPAHVETRRATSLQQPNQQKPQCTNPSRLSIPNFNLPPTPPAHP